MVPGVQRKSAPTTDLKTTGADVAAEGEGGGGGGDFISNKAPPLPTISTEAAMMPLKSSMRRSHWSTPNIATAMRVQTLDESLHSTDLNRSRTLGKPGIDELSASRRGQQQQHSSENGGLLEAGNGNDAGDNSTSSRQSAISFHQIEVREYSRAVGDNPSVSAGPPMSIGWEYNDPDVLTVDEYESTRPPRRAHHEMVVPRSVRQDMLMNEWGYTRSQLAGAVRDSNRTKTQRRTTVNNLDTPFSKFEEGSQSAKRKLKRFLLRRKSDGAMYERWKIEERRARAAIEAEYEAAANVVVQNSQMNGVNVVASNRLPQAQHHRVVAVQNDSGREESKREVEAVGGDTFELISIGSDGDHPPSSPSVSGHGGGRHAPSPLRSLLPPAAVEPEDSVEEADRGASGGAGAGGANAGSSVHSHSRPIVCAEEEDDDDEQLGAALAGAEEAAKNASRTSSKNNGGGSGTIDGSAVKNSMAVYLSK